MDSSCFFAAVTGQPFHSTKEYYDLICNPEASTALLGLALLTSKYSNSISRAAQQQEKQHGQQGAAASKRNQAVEAVTVQAKQPQHELQNAPASPLFRPKAEYGVSTGCRTTAATSAPAAADVGAIANPSAAFNAASADNEDAGHPVLTSSLLDFNLWSCQHVAAAMAAAPMKSCSQTAALAAPYNEALWLEDLRTLKSEALQHL